MSSEDLKNTILASLSTIHDPDFNEDIVSLGFIDEILVDSGKAVLQLVVPSPSHETQNFLRAAILETLQRDFGSELEFEIQFKVDVSRSAGPARHLLNVRNLIAVASGKGGVGKSTVAANLAVALKKMGARVGILDADVYGPSIPMMFGLQDAKLHVKEREGKQWLAPMEAFDIPIMSIGFLVPAFRSTVWRGPIATKAFQQLLLDTDWGELDYLILDVPPGTGDIHLTIVQTIPVTGVVVVTTPQPVAIADATKCVDMFIGPQINVPILGVVENMSYFIPDDAPEKKYYIFGKDGGRAFADKFQVPLLGQVPLVEEARRRSDEGTPIALEDGNIVSDSFRSIASAVARSIAVRNRKQAPTQTVQITRR